jgi:hypothetical protein
VRVFLAEDWEIDTVPAKARETVEFYKNGRIRLVMLARRHSVLTQTYPEGTRLFFDEEGGFTYAQPNSTSGR